MISKFFPPPLKLPIACNLRKKIGYGVYVNVSRIGCVGRNKRDNKKTKRNRKR